MSAWRTTACVNFTHRIGFRMSELFRKNRWRLRRLHILEYATQLSCIWWVGHNRSVALVTRVTANNGSPRSIMQLILLQHGYCTFAIILWRPFAGPFFNLAMRIRAFSQICIHFRTCRTSILEGATFSQNKLVQVPLRKSLQGNRDILPLGTLASGTSGSRCMSLILSRRRARRRIRLCCFCMLIDIVTETTIVSFRTLPVGFPLPTIS